MPLNLEADKLNEAKWWVDASFATHSDMSSHTGGVMSLGKGAKCASSMRQRINTKSSTEAELVGINDAASNIMVLLFSRGSGISSAEAHKNIPRQYEHHTAWKEWESLQWSAHMSHQHSIFFVADWVTKNEVEIIYCPTGDMTADLLTKPLQGSLFKKFGDTILNIQRDASRPPINGMAMIHRSVSRREHDDQRNVRIDALSVSCKWLVSKVVSHDHRWTTQYQLQWPRNNTYRKNSHS